MQLIYITALIVAMSGNSTYVQHKQGFQSHADCEVFLNNESAKKYMEQSLVEYYGNQIKELKGFSCKTREEAFKENQQLQPTQKGVDI